MNVFTGITFDELFANAVGEINEYPQYICKPRGSLIREELAVTLELRDPRARLLNIEARNSNYGFGVGEFLWYWTGKQDLETMLYYNKRMKDFSDDGKNLNSAYGHRLKCEDFFDWNEETFKSQWDICKETLLKDNDSRRALMLINRSWDQHVANSYGSKDVPCTLSLQLFIRDGRLHLHAHMRSNDAFWGLTYDLFSFTLFQEMMLLELRAAGMTDLQLGRYYHTAGSLHIYERHFEMAKAVQTEYLSPAFCPAAPMEPIVLDEMGRLVDYEVALRTGKAEPNGSSQFSGGVRWMAEQLEAHRRKRDAERSQSNG